MKKSILLFQAMLCFASLRAQQKEILLLKDMQQAVINLFEALSNRDSTALKSHCTTDISLYEYGQIWNLDTLIKKAITQNNSADFKRTNRFEFIRTTGDRSTGWVTYRLVSAIVKEGNTITLEWLETVGLIRERKTWKVKHLHSTLIKRS